jgi:carboxyl-terminal processing protease
MPETAPETNAPAPCADPDNELESPRPARRSPAGLLTRVLMVTGAFGAGLLVMGAATALPRSYSPYSKLNIFARVLSYVENNYVENVDQSKLVYGAIKGMLETLDPHTVFLPPDQYREMKIDTQGEFGGLGVEINMQGQTRNAKCRCEDDDLLTVVSAIEGSPAEKAGIRAGDQIVAIDGKPVRGVSMHEAVKRMRGRRGTAVVLTVQREASAPSAGVAVVPAVARTGAGGKVGPATPPKKQELDIRVVRDLIHIVAVKSKMMEPGVGYVRVRSFQERTDRQLQVHLDRLEAQAGGKLKGLILDLRDNPGGLLDQAVRVADEFIESGLIVRTEGKNGRILEEERAHSKGTRLGFPMVVLVNSGSASASEIVAGALQDHGRATILGSQTFGKGSVQTVIELDDGSGLKLTIARYFTPKGRSIQERGITPDVVVEQAPADAAGAPLARTPMRERDLKGHLRNLSTPEPVAGRSVAVRPVGPAGADLQLQAAVDHLRLLRAGLSARRSASSVGRP